MDSRIENCVLRGNTDEAGFGGAFLLGTGPLTFRNNIVSANTGGIGGSVVDLDLDYNDFWQNTGDDYTG